MNWRANQLQAIKVGLRRKVKNKETTRLHWMDAKIPVPYVQLIGQLVTEDEHGDYNEGHEALRRQSYARQMLHEVAKEIRAYGGAPTEFRSKVLTPILQRYVRGVPDSYTPAIRRAIAGGDSMPTIADATRFYLEEDPVDPAHISFYRRNLIYIPESRWYLGILMGKTSVESAADFNKVRANHDNVMEAAQEDDDDDDDDGSGGNSNNDEEPSPFNEVEVQTIVSEGLEEFFEGELSGLVCTLRSSRLPSLTPQYRRENWLRQPEPRGRRPVISSRTRQAPVPGDPRTDAEYGIPFERDSVSGERWFDTVAHFFR